MTLRQILLQFLTIGVIVGPLPNNIVNGQAIDAVPVMADFNWLRTQVNSNAADVTLSNVVTVPTLSGLVLNGAGGVGTWTESILTNGGGGSLLIQNNSTAATAYGLRVLSASTAAPPVAAVAGISSLATGYYAGHFVNVSDRGTSDADNASLIGIVSQSLQSNAAYIEQGGTTQNLVRTCTYPACYITRTINSLGAFDYNGALLKIEDTTAATGDLLTLTKQTVTALRMTSGLLLKLNSGSTGMSSMQFGPDTPSANSNSQLNFLFSNGVKNWQISFNAITSGGIDFTQSTLAGGAIFTTPVFTIDGSQNFGFGVSAFGTSSANVLGLKNATAPGSSPAGMGQLYCLAGALTWRGAGGTVTIIAPS